MSSFDDQVIADFNQTVASREVISKAFQCSCSIPSVPRVALKERSL